MLPDTNHHSLAFRAMLFAKEAHKNQVRKYTGNPYQDHLAEVVGILATRLNHISDNTYLRDVVTSVAWLHDTVEDCGVTIDDLINQKFGEDVIRGVLLLTDMEKGNRATRKALARERLSESAGWIQSIKCADLISNTSSIVKNDPNNFAIVYRKEAVALLEVMTNADKLLWELAMEGVK